MYFSGAIEVIFRANYKTNTMILGIPADSYHMITEIVKMHLNE